MGTYVTIDVTIDVKIRHSEERILKALNAKVCCTCRNLRMAKEMINKRMSCNIHLGNCMTYEPSFTCNGWEKERR